MINSRAMPVPLTPSYRRVAGTAPQHASGRDFADPLGHGGRLLLGQCDTRSHAVSGYVDWRTNFMVT